MGRELDNLVLGCTRSTTLNCHTGVSGLRAGVSDLGAGVGGLEAGVSCFEC